MERNDEQRFLCFVAVAESERGTGAGSNVWLDSARVGLTTNERMITTTTTTNNMNDNDVNQSMESIPRTENEKEKEVRAY